MGHIDSSLVQSLIKNCDALISPSKHEGWATISEESRYFGKYVFLSKIAEFPHFFRKSVDENSNSKIPHFAKIADYF